MLDKTRILDVHIMNFICCFFVVVVNGKHLDRVHNYSKILLCWNGFRLEFLMLFVAFVHFINLFLYF